MLPAMRSKGWRGPFATLMKALFILGALMMLVAVPFGLSFSSLRGRAKYGLAGKSSGVRELQVRRFSDLNPVAQATREQAAEVIKDMPFTVFWFTTCRLCVWCIWSGTFACPMSDRVKSFFSKRANGAYRLYGVGKNRLAMLIFV